MKGDNMKKNVIIFCFVTQLCFISFSYGIKTEDYENYAEKGWSGYPRAGTDIYDWYDQFGNKLITGYELYTHIDITSEGLGVPGGTSLVFKSYRYNRWLNELVIFSDTLEGTYNRVFIGDSIKTKFTSFTFYKADLNGIRWDLGSKYNEFSVITSRLTWPVVLLNTAWEDRPEYYYYDEKPIYLLGLHNVFKIKNQNLGLTYVGIRKDNKLATESSWYGVGSGVTGLGVYGGDIKGVIKNINYKGEYAISESYIDGSPSGKRYPAYYLELSRGFNKLSIGGNYHYIDSQYNTTFRSPDVKMRYYYTPTGGVDYFNLVDDNDDNDQYPDEIDQMSWSEYLSRKYEFFTQIDGVFPGLDKNKNGISDYNENRNAYPDYLEDFLMFYVDPPEFEIGDDDNNNGVIDIFENDNLPDYKFYRDHQGYAVWSEYMFQPNLKLKLKYNDETLVSNVNKTSKFYEGILTHNTKLAIADVNLEMRAKYVKDTIPNDVYEYSVVFVNNRPQSQYTLIEDKLQFTDSLVYTIFCNFVLTKFKNFKVESKIKHMVNTQDVDVEPRAAMFLGNINKIYYELLLLNDKILISPMIKSQLSLYYGSPAKQSFVNAYIFKTEYRFTKLTKITLGYQYLTQADLLNTSLAYPNNYDKQSYILQLTNNSRYLKYALSFMFGIKRELFSDKTGKIGQADTWFFNVYLGG
jgi:hypothetical protein